jgi:hypothetical protein
VSVLLREPYGFEGFRPRVEGAPPDALPVPPPGYLPDALVQRNVAARAVAACAQHSDRQVSKVAYFDSLHGEVRPDREHVVPQARIPSWPR